MNLKSIVIFGGVLQNAQIKSLKSRVDILIGEKVQLKVTVLKENSTNN